MKTTAITLAMLACALIPLRGAVIVKQAASKPTTGVKIAHELPTGGTSGNISAYYRNPLDSGTPLYRGVGIAFAVTESFELGAVTWDVISMGADVPGTAFSLRIYEVAAVKDNIPANSPGAGTLLSTQQGTLPADLSLEASFLSLGLDTPVNLQSGKFYAVVFTFTEPSSSTTSVGHLSFRTTGSSVPNGEFAPRRWVDSGGEWQSVGGGNQPIIYLQAQAIPEPRLGLFTLFGGGFVLGILHLRKRFH